MHKRISDIKAEENDIAVVHDVILAFAADKPRFLAGGKRAFFDKRLIWHYLKPRSKSVWILPAAPGAFVPRFIVQARTSGSPAVRKDISPSSE